MQIKNKIFRFLFGSCFVVFVDFCGFWVSNGNNEKLVLAKLGKCERVNLHLQDGFFKHNAVAFIQHYRRFKNGYSRYKKCLVKYFRRDYDV